MPHYVERSTPTLHYYMNEIDYFKVFFVFYSDNMATDWTIYVSKAFISNSLLYSVTEDKNIRIPQNKK
jgi:hypothetical protein